MSYVWVIVGSVIGFALTSYQRWHMSNVSFEPIQRSNDPYVFLIGIIILLHFFYFGGKIGSTPKTKKINKLFENQFLGAIIILGVLILLGIIGSYIVDFTLY